MKKKYREIQKKCKELSDLLNTLEGPIFAHVSRYPLDWELQIFTNEDELIGTVDGTVGRAQPK